MKQKFWLERWEQEQIGFHQSEINRYLSEHWEQLGLPSEAAVFVPLCGKSLDMLWLHQQGHPVMGVELSEKAVEAFFEENQIEAELQRGRRFSTYRSDGLRLLCGDFFDLEREDLEGIQAVYDRAALIALPPSMRADYAHHMARLLPAGAHILLITMEYPAGTLEGPPFSVTEEEVRTLFDPRFTVSLQASWEGAEGPRGVEVTEKIYTLTRRGG